MLTVRTDIRGVLMIIYNYLFNFKIVYHKYFLNKVHAIKFCYAFLCQFLLMILLGLPLLLLNFKKLNFLSYF